MVSSKDAFEDMEFTTTSGADTAAGSAPADLAVPTGMRWKFHHMIIPVVNDAGVADRTLTVDLYDEGDVLFWTKDFGVTTASQDCTLVISAGEFTDDTTGTYQLISIEPTLVDEMKAGWYFDFTYTNIEAGDNFGAVVVHHKQLRSGGP